jgi:hypothetical protein
LKVLLLTFYFHPDLSAGSFRATALVKALREIDSSIEVDVVTTLPNRYCSFSTEAPVIEQAVGVIVHRLELPAHKSGMLDQSMAFWSFASQALNMVRHKKYDLIIATSSRLMTAVLGAWIASRKRVPLYLDIRDIFVDTIKDVLPTHMALIARPLFEVMERWAIRQASAVNLVSRGFATYFVDRYPWQKFSYFTNGIDEEFLAAQPAGPSEQKQTWPIRALYAGNIGEGQGLHAILPELGKRLEGRVNFRIIGDGGRKELLQNKLDFAGVTNVDLLPPMPRDQLIHEYKQADVLFLHLNDYDAFKKVLPSKVFEYAALGKPIWAGIPGYSAEFVRTEISNAAIFPPCNAGAAEQVLANLVIRDAPRWDFTERFARANICHDLANDILSVIR